MDNVRPPKPLPPPAADVNRLLGYTVALPLKADCAVPPRELYAASDIVVVSAPMWAPHPELLGAGSVAGLTNRPRTSGAAALEGWSAATSPVAKRSALALETSTNTTPRSVTELAGREEVLAACC